MQCLGPACPILIGYLASRSVTVSVPFSTLASAARRIFPRKWIISSSSAICLRMDNTPASCCVACKRVLNRNTFSACFYLPAAVVYPAAVVQGIEAAEIPRHAYTCHIVCTEFIFQHIQPRIAVGTLHKKPETGHYPCIQCSFLDAELFCLSLEKAEFGTVIYPTRQAPRYFPVQASEKQFRQGFLFL